MERRCRRRWSLRHGLVGLAALAAFVPGAGSADVLPASGPNTGYPAGQYLWEFGITSVSAQSTPGDNWARVGEIQITSLAPPSLTETYWQWQQSDPVGHATARTDACPAPCSLYTPAGYQGSGQTKTGTWTFDAATGQFAVVFSDNAYEVWVVNSGFSSSDVARMDLNQASYSFGHGWTYGSSPSPQYGPSASWLLAHAPGPYDNGYGCWSDNPNDNLPDTCKSGGLSLQGWHTCSSECISDVAPCSSCSSGSYDDKYLLGTESGIQPRKVFYENYAFPTSAGSDYCPSNTQSEHVRALREVVGTSGRVYGFIGVEASLYSTAGTALDRVGAWHWTDIAGDPEN